MTINPHVDAFLTIYSQSDRSTGGTRGYDPETYVETKLDRNLVPRIFDPTTKLVILTGNAGDGKTAFIQHVERIATDRKTNLLTQTENGSTFLLNGVTYQTLYDGSQDFEGAANDAVPNGFFKKLRARRLPWALLRRSLPPMRESYGILFKQAKLPLTWPRATTVMGFVADVCPRLQYISFPFRYQQTANTQRAS